MQRDGSDDRLRNRRKLTTGIYKGSGIERPRSAEHAEISAIIPPSLFGDFLDKAIHEAPENVFVFSLCDPANAGMCLRYSYEELVTKGIVDVFISISFDENVLLICMNKSLVSPRDVYPQIKALHLH